MAVMEFSAVTLAARFDDVLGADDEPVWEGKLSTEVINQAAMLDLRPLYEFLDAYLLTIPHSAV